MPFQISSFLGRTHQIRIHLQYLGYPIINDSMYNHKAWGDERFQHGPCTKDVLEVARELSQDYNFSPYRAWQSKLDKESSVVSSNCLNTDDNLTKDKTCETCHRPIPDPDVKKMIMYLHAYRYKGIDWDFKSKLPDWAELERKS